MGRFVLGMLVGAVAMYWYDIYGDAVLRDVVRWFLDTAGGYGQPPG